ncbi:MAG: helix-turn-helix domain-containing protein [Prosthecobacter sp.]
MFLIKRLSLTRRQAEVLHWIAEGKTNEEIGLILGLSFHTVKNHVSQLFQRLGVPGRTAAAACAYHAHIRGAKNFRVTASHPPASPRSVITQ